MKAMTKYQLEHFKDKVKSKFAPMLEESDLSLRKIVADMTESAEKKLSDKIGATEIIKDLQNAEAEHIKAMKKARTFFTKNITAEQSCNALVQKNWDRGEANAYAETLWRNAK